MRKHLNWLVIVVPLFLMILGNGIAWPHLADRIPIHWNFKGEVDSWGGKGMIWLLPCLFLWTSFLLSMITLRLPGPHDDANRKSVLWVQTGIGILFVYIQGAILKVASDLKTGLSSVFIVWGFGIFMITLSWSFKACKRNNLVGIRTKWTLASDENWDRTHRFASSIFTLAGSLMIGTAYFVNLLAPAGIFFTAGGLFLAAVLATLIYSYRQRPA
ncbi:MAG TPA: SdpI family protein [Oligoflexus sp.]|uniref:SdpI family protein n=1 Tax=Oligoflexus sp. TaxID=1971216 RepID=UPI002D800365|nr:SdpI family protein [Oligoflexus sp.]HET9235902.1 SdpI family protein [Oligoflexus sp.]